MAILGWVLAYWAFWMLIGSLVMAVRFPDFLDELAEFREDPLDEQLSLLWGYLHYLTLWPRKYWVRERSEDYDDDEDEEL